MQTGRKWHERVHKQEARRPEPCEPQPHNVTYMWATVERSSSRIFASPTLHIHDLESDFRNILVDDFKGE